MDAKKNRLYVIDALRGFAIISILLLHNIEHFDVYFLPKDLPEWVRNFDTKIWDTLFFLFGGKSYAIFALLFGLTYHIQMSNQEKRGNDFRFRFLWRLVLLFCFGMINTIFFAGDILTLYAFIGLFLIPFYKVKTNIAFIIAIVLFLQPIEIYNLINYILHPDIQLENPQSWVYYGRMREYIYGNSFLATAKGNILNGKLSAIFWYWENGRFIHVLSLFIFGMLAGRKQLFIWNDQNKKFWRKTLLISTFVFIPFFALKLNIEILSTNKTILRPLNLLLKSWSDIPFMLILVSSFILLFHHKLFHKKLNFFTPIGSMSLTNYVFQSIIGALIYYAYGLSLYKYTGATYSLIIGLTLAILMGYFCTIWAKKFKRGPLETIWHKLTWLNSKP